MPSFEGLSESNSFAGEQDAVLAEMTRRARAAATFHNRIEIVHWHAANAACSDVASGPGCWLFRPDGTALRMVCGDSPSRGAQP